MKNMNIRFKYYYIGAIIVVSLAYLGYRYMRKDALYRNGALSYAYIYEVNRGNVKAGNIVIKYFFFHNTKKYFGGADSDLSYDVKDSMLGRYYPALFDSLDADNNVLLIDLKTWEKLNREFPDSLQWLMKYYPPHWF